MIFRRFLQISISFGLLLFGCENTSYPPGPIGELLSLSYDRVTVNESSKDTYYLESFLSQYMSPLFGDSYIQSPANSQIEFANIGGYMKGQSDSIVFLVAHYDVADADFLSQPVPGANDNTSGVVAILQLVEAIQNPYYSIVVLLTDGEEEGLWGATYFSENLPSLPGHVKTVINLDMVGRFNQYGGFYLINGSSPLLAILSSTTISTSLIIDSSKDSLLHNRTDLKALSLIEQESFSPTHSFTITGFETEYPYHHSSDDISTLDFHAIGAATELLFWLVKYPYH